MVDSILRWCLRQHRLRLKEGGHAIRSIDRKTKELPAMRAKGGEGQIEDSLGYIASILSQYI